MKQEKFKTAVVLGLFILTVLTGCSSGDFSADRVASESVSNPVPPMVTDSMDFAVMDFDDSFLSTESTGINILSPTTTGRQLIYTTDMNLQTTDFMPTVRLLLDTVASFDGYSEWVLINGRCLSRPDITRSANFTLRIPTDNLERFIYFIENNYNVIRLEKRMVDHSNVYQNDNFELEILRAQEQELVDNDASQAELNNIRRQIRDLERTTNNLQNRVAYSTVTVNLSEFIEIIEPDPANFGERAVVILSNSFQVVIIIFLALLPWAIPGGLITGLIIFLTNRSEKKRQKRIGQPIE